MILLILWAACSLITIVQYAHCCVDLDPLSYFEVFIILAVGGPIFVVNSGLEAVLDSILPEGWDDNGANGVY